MKTQLEQTNAKNELRHEQNSDTNSLLSDLRLAAPQAEQIKGGPIDGGDFLLGGRGDDYLQGIHSQHAGGVIVGLGDGSVRGISN